MNKHISTGMDKVIGSIWNYYTYILYNWRTHSRKRDTNGNDDMIWNMEYIQPPNNSLNLKRKQQQEQQQNAIKKQIERKRKIDD